MPGRVHECSVSPPGQGGAATLGIYLAQHGIMKFVLIKYSSFSIVHYLFELFLTMQIKSFDIRMFFLPYFLNPNPAGILAANLKEGE